MEKDINEIIDLYTEGKLTGKELDDFLQTVETNSELAMEVGLHQQISRILKNDAAFELREKLQSIHEANKLKAGHRVLKLRFYKVAAGIAALIGIGILMVFVLRAPLNKRIYSQYYKIYDASYATRSVSVSADKFKKAMENYTAGNYKDSWILLKNITDNDKTDMGSFFFRGICAMETDNFDDAITSFNAVIADRRSLYVEQSEWYYALCLLKKDDMISARIQFRKISDGEGFYKDKAKEILSDLGNN